VLLWKNHCQNIYTKLQSPRITYIQSTCRHAAHARVYTHTHTNACTQSLREEEWEAAQDSSQRGDTGPPSIMLLLFLLFSFFKKKVDHIRTSNIKLLCLTYIFSPCTLNLLCGLKMRTHFNKRKRTDGNELESQRAQIRKWSVMDKYMYRRLQKSESTGENASHGHFLSLNTVFITNYIISMSIWGKCVIENSNQV